MTSLPCASGCATHSRCRRLSRHVSLPCASGCTVHPYDPGVGSRRPFPLRVWMDRGRALGCIQKGPVDRAPTLRRSPALLRFGMHRRRQDAGLSLGRLFPARQDAPAAGLSQRQAEQSLPYARRRTDHLARGLDKATASPMRAGRSPRPGTPSDPAPRRLSLRIGMHPFASPSSTSRCVVSLLRVGMRP